jgi:hypothetical protein
MEVLELLNRAVKAELAVLHDQDDFYIDDLVEPLDALKRKLEEEKL